MIDIKIFTSYISQYHLILSPSFLLQNQELYQIQPSFAYTTCIFFWTQTQNYVRNILVWNDKWILSPVLWQIGLMLWIVKYPKMLSRLWLKKKKGTVLFILKVLLLLSISEWDLTFSNTQSTGVIRPMLINLQWWRTYYEGSLFNFRTAFILG